MERMIETVRLTRSARWVTRATRLKLTRGVAANRRVCVTHSEMTLCANALAARRGILQLVCMRFSIARARGFGKNWLRRVTANTARGWDTAGRLCLSWPRHRRAGRLLRVVAVSALCLSTTAGQGATPGAKLAGIRLAADGHSFVTDDGRAFAPFGVNYYRPGTGWAPQVWKQFDAEATRRDFARMKELGVNCVRVFLSYGSFYMEPGALDTNGLAKFDRFLALAEEHGIYVHPTGPDHWEGIPRWAREDRVADEKVLEALEEFWKLFAARYRNRTVIFAYDLRNEPEVSWYNGVMRRRWHQWVAQKYGTPEKVAVAWKTNGVQLDHLPMPTPLDAPRDPLLLDYQRFREDVADEWTRRQVAAIKTADPKALVTVGLIQWSVPSLLPRVSHYSGFHPARQAKLLDFLEVHFYPLDSGALEYRSAEEIQRNLAYLETVVREVARPGKPVVIGEFGWYGGGQPKFDQGKHPAASEEQQANWCSNLVVRTSGMACGWLNWGFYDQPEARDVSELTGLRTADGKVKAWGRTFRELAARYAANPPVRVLPSGPELDWDLCLTSSQAGHEYRARYFQAWQRRNASGGARE